MQSAICNFYAIYNMLPNNGRDFYTLHYRADSIQPIQTYAKVNLLIKCMILNNLANLKIIRELEDWPYTASDFVQVYRFKLKLSDERNRCRLKYEF